MYSIFNCWKFSFSRIIMKRFTIYIHSFGLYPIIYAITFFELVHLCVFFNKPFGDSLDMHSINMQWALDTGHWTMFSSDYGAYLVNVNDNFGWIVVCDILLFWFQHQYMDKLQFVYLHILKYFLGWRYESWIWGICLNIIYSMVILLYVFCWMVFELIIK